MAKIYVPSEGLEDWRHFLAEPDRQWATGFYAKTVAHCWEEAKGIPPKVAAILEPLGPPELLIAIPEHKVPLPGARRGESQNDLFMLARAGTQTVAVAVEGKVNEPFGQPLTEWLVNASPGKHERLAFLCELLGLTQPLPGDVHYQLLHRTASAVIEARRFKTDVAAMIVHSFSSERKWFDAFARFTALFGANAEPNKLIALRLQTSPALYSGWACGDCEFLKR
jgi:hypothetical protein